ncbi:MAG: hypothetical protein E6R13_04435 [Spirochaetes bacterium]|nr:MAG: hypothetical protein E6R13_04435 [Spirochaetota bacterium]
MTNTITLDGFPASNPISPENVLYADQNGSEVKLPLNLVSNWVQSNIIKSYFGNPNNNVAGQTYQICYDYQNNLLYICTLSGTVSSTVWELVNTQINPSQFNINQIVITADQIYNKPSNLSHLMVECIGAGGGGGYAVKNLSGYVGMGQSGGGGSYARSILPYSSLSSSISCTIGIEGQGGIGSSLTPATDGGTTSFGLLVSASGGKGGSTFEYNTAFVIDGALGGNVCTGQIIVFGEPGSKGICINPSLNISISAGQGASSKYGIGGQGVLNGDGGFGDQFGAGGGGCATTNLPQDGGNGSNGVIILTEYLFS